MLLFKYLPGKRHPDAGMTAERIDKMNSGYSIPLKILIDEFGLEEITIPARKVLITNPEVNRPGLALAGFFELFEPSRIQIIGKAEFQYLSRLDSQKRALAIENFINKKPIAIIMSTGLEVYDDFVSCAKDAGVPILRSKEKTSQLMASLIASLNLHLAPRITRHGVLVEVYGEGLLLLGESGVGKSETAIELVKRGHRLIADDAVEIKRASAKALVGSAPEIIRHYVELRGIGIVDVRRLFGMGAVNNTEKIDLVINLEHWIQGKMYDRLGLDEEKVDILGIALPCITIPVKPGRNLAIIIEIAAMNNRLKKMGYNTAEEFNKKLMNHIEAQQKAEQEENRED